MRVQTYQVLETGERSSRSGCTLGLVPEEVTFVPSSPHGHHNFVLFLVLKAGPEGADSDILVFWGSLWLEHLPGLKEPGNNTTCLEQGYSWDFCQDQAAGICI